MALASLYPLVWLHTQLSCRPLHIAVYSDASRHGTLQAFRFQSLTPGNICLRAIEGLSQICDSERHSEEVKSIPGPRNECAPEEKPLFLVQHSQQSDWVVDLLHRRLQCGQTSGEVLADGHVRLPGGASRGKVDIVVVGGMLGGGEIAALLVDAHFDVYRQGCDVSCCF